MDDLKDLKPRVIHAAYETFQTKSDYSSRNIKELDIFELSEKVANSLKTSRVGKDRPLVILAFSMGGLVCKLVLNNNKEIADNTKCVVFYATPHFGSDVRDDTASQMQDMLSGMNSFMNHNSIADEDFVAYLLDNLKVSKVALFLISPDRVKNMEIINKRFREFTKPTVR